MTRIGNTSLLLLTCVLTNVATAANIVGVEYSGDGHYLVSVRDGKVTVIPIEVVSVNPSPNPPPKPQPNPLSERAEAIREKAVAVDHAERELHAQSLAMLYVELAKAVDAGKIKTANELSLGLRTGSDMILTTPAAKLAWTDVRVKLSDQWAAIAQEGGEMPAYASLLRDAASGLNASVDSNAKAVNIAVILEILKIILELIAKLRPSP